MTNTTNTERLKPCPFCGQPGFLSKAGSPEWFSVGCSGLFGCPAYLRAQVHRTESAAIAAWNTRAALAEVEGQAVPQGWQPIETAPKDGHTVLVWPWWEGGVDTDYWNERTGWLPGVTHWMPLPAPPGAAAPEAPAAPTVAEPEPLFLLHTGQIDSSGEQDEWDCAADSQRRVEAFCRQHPGVTVKLYAHPPAPTVVEPVAYVELTDAECDEFRRHQGDFNSMLRATHRAGYSRVVVSPPAPREPDEFTDTARSALLWVLWHHQGGSSPVGQPIRYALGMGRHDDLTETQLAEAKRWGDAHPVNPSVYPRGEAPREPLTADEATKNKYGEWTHTIKGQPVSDNVPLKHECDGGSDYCMHCGIDMTGPYGSTPCDGLEQARRRQIKPETVAVFGCDAEARGLGACQQWCQGLQCPYTRSAAGDERTHGTGTDREGE